MMSINCGIELHSKKKLNYGDLLLKEPYLIVAEYLKTVNLILELRHAIELYLKLKVGLIRKMISMKFVLMQICSRIMYLKLRNKLKSILKTHQRNALHFSLLYWIDYYNGITNE
jgi:hypothetical protein